MKLWTDTLVKYYGKRKVVDNVSVEVSQGEIVADSLKDYLHRHPEIETKVSKEGERTFYTTDSVEDFDNKATIFFGEQVEARHLDL